MKKLFKNSYIALAVLALGFSACTEEVEYTPAQAPTNEQIYFSNTNGAQIDLAQDAKSFDIAVSRAQAGAAASIDVNVTADSLAQSVFEFPATVEFADSASTAVYTVTVKEGATLEFELYHTVTLAFDEALTTPYGNGSYSFKVGVPAPWSEWAKMGTGTYTLTGSYWNGTHSGLTIYYREYQLNDTDAQFYIPGIANSMDLTIEYNRQTGNCQVLPQYAATSDKYGQVTVCDPPHYPLQEGLTYEDFPCFYDAEHGLLSLNLVYFVCTDYNANTNGMFGNGVETFQIDGFAAPEVIDHSFSMEFKGHYIDNAGNDNAVIATTKGKDVAQYLLTVVSANEDAQATVSGMLNGTVACDTLTESGFYAYNMTESGNYKAFAITFDAEGNALDAYAKDFEFYMAGQESPWQSLGYAVYTDDVILPLFGNPAMPYYVEVLENKDQPGLFRMVDPYGPEFPLYPYASSYAAGSYIEIDATDPEGVWIEGWQSTGLDIQNNGLMSITSMAWYQVNAQGATKEDAKEAGLCGVYADGVITFPADGILTELGGKAYYGNRNGAFALDMTNLIESLPEGAAAARSAAARANVELKAEAMGKVTRFKKIDNSFMTIKGIEIQ